MIRIVKMTFSPDKVDEFLQIFNQVKDKIRNFEGVEHLELLKDKENPNTYFTYSIWKSDEQLEKYRNADLFKTVWIKIKPMFIEKAEAWSVEKVMGL